MGFRGEQFHGYRNGHQLLRSSVELARRDQDTVDRLSDLSGPLSPNELFEPYLTCYPLPNAGLYVLALTWQDREAPRAGCVKTRSLFLSSEDLLTANVGTCVPFLVSPSPELGSRDVEEGRLSLEGAIYPESEPFLKELTEAIFLEPKAPIVAFGQGQANLIITKLLVALWPARRGIFSACGYSIAPRSTGSGPMDLLFAPRSSKSRYAAWEGRKIEFSTSFLPRHRWTNEIVASVFFNEPAGFASLDDLGLFELQDATDDSALRLNLLWRDLRVASDSSPRAILAMIDIASASSTRQSAWSELGSLAERALVIVRSLPIDERWEFLLALSGKVGSHPLRQSIGGRLLIEIGVLALEDAPVATQVAVENFEREGLSWIWPSAMAAVASDVCKEVLLELERAAPDTIFGLVSTCMALSSAISQLEKSSALAAVVRGCAIALDALPMGGRQQHLGSISPLFQRDEGCELLSTFLESVSKSDLIEIASILWNGVDGRSKLAATMISEKARQLGAESLVRDELTRVRVDPHTVSAVSRLVGCSISDVSWILNRKGLEHHRCELLDGVLRAASLSEIHSLTDAPEGVLECLVVLIDGGASESAGKLLVACWAEDLLYAEAALALLPNVAGWLRDQMFDRALNFALESKGDRDRTSILAKLCELRGAESVVNHAIRVGSSPQRVTRFLAAYQKLLASPVAPKRPALSTVAKNISKRDEFDLGISASRALASIVESTQNSDPMLARQMSAMLLPYALGSRSKEAWPLVVATFPSVHESLKTEDESFGFRKLFRFDDWDKCKSARRELVRAFMSSEWPPEQLIVLALRIGEPGRVLRRVRKEDGGDVFLARLRGSIDKVRSSKSAAFLRELERVQMQNEVVADSQT